MPHERRSSSVIATRELKKKPTTRPAACTSGLKTREKPTCASGGAEGLITFGTGITAATRASYSR